MTKLEKAERLALHYAEQITELENKIADIKANCDLAIEGRDIKIRELEEKISVLLSCKNCPENKGGYICEKEYNDKCLSQKIQYIKELEEENNELLDVINNQDVKIADLEKENKTLEGCLFAEQEYTLVLEKENAELKQQIEKMKCCENCAGWYKLPNGQCSETCENLDNWSLRR